MRVVTGFLMVAGVLGASVVGCGGSSFSAEDEPQAGKGGSASGGSGGTGTGGTGASGGSGGTGSGGTAGVGGSSTGGSGVGGSGVGGSGVGGSSPGSGGTTAVGGGQATGGSGAQAGGTGGTAAGGAGAGGATEDHCLLPADSGPCEAAFERWYFDAATGVCRPFIYGGCEGNENNFETLEACSASCAGAGMTDPTACEQPTDCMVTAIACCGGSSMPTLRDVTAINAASYEEFTWPCQLVDCASTLGPIPPQIGATCSAGHCVAFDLRETTYSECGGADECVLRNGLSCCGGCGSNGWVALRADAEIGELICGDGPIACDPCVAIPDPNTHALCLEGRCEVVMTVSTP